MKKIKIFSSDFLRITFTNKAVPFLYSHTQYLDLDEEKDIYQLKFNVGVYYNKYLLLGNKYYGYAYNLDNCEVEQKEMICNISREKVESFVFF